MNLALTLFVWFYNSLVLIFCMVCTCFLGLFECEVEGDWSQ